MVGTEIGTVQLRDMREDDLPVIFEQQRDPVANRMAAFTVEDPANRDDFMARWNKILGDDAIIKKVVLVNEQVVGSILSFEQFGEREVGYWLGKDHWGRGIATKALALFLIHVKVRPLYARAAADNCASIRVLKKCGFKICGEDKTFANARGEDVEEFTFRLDADRPHMPR